MELAHPDLAANLWVNPGEIPGNGIDEDGNGYTDDVHGWNFFNDSADVSDDHGHGTHVAGTAAAVGNNGTGVIGVAFESRIMVIKGLDQFGRGFLSDLAEGILYAVENGARVINASWGSIGSSQTLVDALAFTHAAGVVFVTAVGNANADVDHVRRLFTPGVFRFQPAANRNAIAVAAFDHLDQKAFFSNYGLKIDIAAPGGGDDGPSSIYDPFRSVLSLLASGARAVMTDSGQLSVGADYLRQAGTSMASPHVAEAAAVILSARPDYTPEQVRQALRAGADDVDAPGFDRNAGYGRLNLHRSLQVEALAAHIASPENRTLASGATLTIRGSAHGPGFVSYRLEYASNTAPETWIPLFGPIAEEVVDGELAVWDISGLPDAFYTVRVVAEHASGRLFEDRLLVHIDRIELTAPEEDSFHREAGLLEIRGRIAPADLIDYAIEYRAYEPTHRWTAWSGEGIVLAGGGQQAVHDGLLATFDTTWLPGPRQITFHVTTNMASGQRQFMVNDIIVDPTLKAGWPRLLTPILLDGGGTLLVEGRNMPTLVDLDGDGTTEILVSWGAFVHAFRSDGSELPGWPVEIPNVDYGHYPAGSGPSVADLDGDGDLEVVVNRTDRIFIFNHDGSPVPGWPRVFQGSFDLGCTLADLDDDGSAELVFGGSRMGGNTPAVHAVRIDGSELPGFPVDPEETLGQYGHALAVGDVDGDGSPDIVVTWKRGFGRAGRPRKLRLYVFDAQGRVKRRFPRSIGSQPFATGGVRGFASPPVLADLDGDGVLDIIVANHRNVRKINAFRGDGKRIRLKIDLPPFHSRRSRDTQDPVVAADVTGDGIPEVFVGTDLRNKCFFDCATAQANDFLVAITPGQGPLPGWPIAFAHWGHDKSHGTGAPAIGDIDGDGEPEVVVGSGHCRGFKGTLFQKCFGVWAFARDGTLLPDFPKPTHDPGVTEFATVAIGDLEGDGIKEIVWVDWRGRLMVWEVAGVPGPVNLLWPMARQNPAHTGALPVVR